jgi:hypothetical protein
VTSLRPQQERMHQAPITQQQLILLEPCTLSVHLRPCGSPNLELLYAYSRCFFARRQMLRIISLQDKGDIIASAAAARANPHTTTANANAACPSAFQLVGGAEGQPGQGSRAAARAAANAEQQRRQQLAAVPRAVDVLGLIGREEGGSSGGATVAGAAGE